MKYLSKEEIVNGNIVKVKDEEVVLIESAGPALTFIDEDYADQELDINDTTPVLGKQRWLVDIIPKSNFDKVFRTHRVIIYYEQTFRERVLDMPRISETGVEYRREQLEGKDVKINRDLFLNDDFNESY